jgi:hypothetical protein
VSGTNAAGEKIVTSEKNATGAGRVPARELTSRTLIARFRELEVHLVTAREAPATMEEIGRIREREFSAVGAGRGGDVDLDRYDTRWPWYSQLVSWDPREEQIVAMYRAIHCGWALEQGGREALRTAQLFSFSEEFEQGYLRCSVELGRSVVNQQAKRALAGLFSVWTGLGAMTREWPEVRYFFGNVSLYRSLPRSAVARVLEYLFRWHRATPGLVTAHRRTGDSSLEAIIAGTGTAAATGAETVTHAAGDRGDQDAGAALARLQDDASREGWTVPPILLSYLKAHPGLLAFDVAEDDDFGGALEVAIAVPTRGVNPRTAQRFIDPYESINGGRFRLERDKPRVEEEPRQPGPGEGT